MRKWQPENLAEFNKGKKAQTFKKEYWIRCGKKVDVDQFIQENREDTELIPALNKYGCIPAQMLDTTKVYGDLLNIKNLKDQFKMVEETKNVFNELPTDVKAQFNNDIKEFTKNGLKYIENIIKKEQEQQKQENTGNENNQPKGE